MDYLEVPIWTTEDGYGLCSDSRCPCNPEVKIPRGGGYLFIRQEMVDFRRDALTTQELNEKITRMEKQTGKIVFIAQSMQSPILVCEQGAKLRELDLEVAAADAQHWWETGLVPLRATPLASAKK